MAPGRDTVSRHSSLPYTARVNRSHVPETGWKSAQVNGLELAYFEDGDGPLVLLLHGFPDTPHTWDLITPALVGAGYRVVRPFGRGITPSEKPKRDDYDPEHLGGDALGLIDALGEDKAIIVGHDWGASGAWGAGHLGSERIDKLVIVAIPHPLAIGVTLGKVWGARHFFANKAPWAEGRFQRNDFAEIRKMYERWSPGFEWPESEFEAAKNAYSHPGCLDAALGYYRSLKPGWPLRQPITCDTLVLGGKTDGVATAEDFEKSRKRVEGPCTVEMLPGGHFLHREHPKAFEAALLKFLSTNP